MFRAQCGVLFPHCYWCDQVKMAAISAAGVKRSKGERFIQMYSKDREGMSLV
jgi:hypothetical protein